MYASRGWIIWIKSKILLHLFQKTFISHALFDTHSIDLPRQKKNLVVNSLVIENRFLSKLQLSNLHTQFINNNANISGSIKYERLNYVDKWSRRYARNSMFIGLNESISDKLELLNNLFFHTEYLPCTLKSHTNLFSLTDTDKKPRVLPEPINLTKRWLLVGTVETGKSYIVKHIAKKTHVPLVHVSLKAIRHATPDLKYNTLKKYNKWIKQLADRGFLLWNILKLAKILSPSIFWISDLHEFHGTSYDQKSQKGKIYDASLLLTILLKIMGNDLLPENNTNITLIGSTHNPSLLDPKFVSGHRLDLIMNLRKPSFNQRQTLFTNLLNNKALYIQTKRAFCELGNYTIGYSVRDITTLTNEILLIKLKGSNNVVNSNVIRLAVYRQLSKQSANNSILETQDIQYKIGKAILQTILVYSRPLLPITKRHDLWKTRFYYLSNAFLEFSDKKSTITELVMFNNILNCLSGSAARDAWIFSKQKFDKQNLIISKQLKHDLSIASNILQSLLLEFPMRETSQVNINKDEGIVPNARGRYILNIMQKTRSSLNFFGRFTSYIYWSYRIERLSLNWNLLFDSIVIRTNKDILAHSNSEYNTKNNSNIIATKHVNQDIPYERRITKRQEKRTKKNQHAFNQVFIENNLKNIGLPWISEYVMNYDALQLSILLLETRPLWNPPALTPSYSVLFFDRDLLINRNMLTKLYITYGEKFQNEKLNPKRIKKQVLWSDISIHNTNINENANTQDRNIEDFISFKEMAKTNGELEQLQIQPTVYLYQSLTSLEYDKTFRYCDLLHHRVSLENDILKTRELLIYGILLEIYHCLFNFFIKNQELVQNIEDALLQRGSLNREHIEIALKRTTLL
jgi:hypothetical protein